MVDAESTGTSALQGLRVFVAEDESLILMLLEDILADLGCEVAGSALNARAGLEVASSVEADIAILDINLGGEPVFPVAEQLAARGIPIVFASGYGATALPDAWKTFPTLPKPFSTEQVAAVLQTTRTNGLGVSSAGPA